MLELCIITIVIMKMSFNNEIAAQIYVQKSSAKARMLDSTQIMNYSTHTLDYNLRPQIDGFFSKRKSFFLFNIHVENILKALNMLSCVINYIQKLQYFLI